MIFYLNVKDWMFNEMYENIKIPANSKKIIKVFSVIFLGVASPNPTVVTVSVTKYIA